MMRSCIASAYCVPSHCDRQMHLSAPRGACGARGKNDLRHTRNCAKAHSTNTAAQWAYNECN
eukprot:6213382-Pleurochrysis_carterae.AAC.1